MDASLLRNLLHDQFEIGEITRIEIFLKWQEFEQFGATIFLIHCLEKRYVLKVFASEQPRQQCLLEARLLNWLHEQDLPIVPAMIRTKSGAWLAELNGSRLGLLIGYVPCARHYRWSQPDWSLVSCQAAGAALAAMHNKLANLPADLLGEWQLSPSLPPSTLGSTGQIGVSSIRGYLKGWLISAFETVRSEPQAMPKVLQEAVLTKASAVMDLSDRAELKMAGQPISQSFFVHGDFHAGNLIWQGDSVQAIIDFENAHYENPIYDLAYAVLMFSCNWQGQITRAAFSSEYGAALVGEYLANSRVVQAEEFTRLFSGYLSLTGALVCLWLTHDCLRRNRFHSQLAYLLDHLGELERLGSLVASRTPLRDVY